MQDKIYTAIGLMSGTSLDGIDAAVIRTDGQSVVKPMAFLTIAYDDITRKALRACLGCRADTDGRVARAERAMTEAHARVVKTVIQAARIKMDDVDLIGFHGQTVFHDPDNRFTWQIGDGPLLAKLCGRKVVYDFRSADVAAGGQGAPLIPVYHAALAVNLPKPVAILNIGGVANVTYIGTDGSLIAFDTGPGNALIDDWVLKRTGGRCDLDGKIAAAGTIDSAALSRLLQNPFFEMRVPKSLDRDAWATDFLQDLSLEDGAATLSAFTVAAVEQALHHLPEKPKAWYVTGGGRHNPVLMKGLARALRLPVKSVDTLGWDGDALEAQGFAYMAVRSELGLPISFPSTTGVPAAMCGGRACLPA
jgi:anhydro-N-acetylmuramic acid kinase